MLARFTVKTWTVSERLRFRTPHLCLLSCAPSWWCTLGNVNHLPKAFGNCGVAAWIAEYQMKTSRQ